MVNNQDLFTISSLIQEHEELLTSDIALDEPALQNSLQDEPRLPIQTTDGWREDVIKDITPEAYSGARGGANSSLNNY